MSAGRSRTSGDAASDEKRPSWYRLVLWSVLAVALLVRVAVVLDFDAHHPLAERPVIDEASYERWALEIADGDWVGNEVFFQEPLYPYWLATIFAVAGPDRTVVRLVQALLGALTCVGVSVLTKRAFGSTVAAAIAGFGLALHPTHALMACLLLKPNLFVPLWTLLAVLVVGPRSDGALPAAAGSRPGLRPVPSARTVLWIGVLGGLGALLRGNALILLPVLVAWPALSRALRWSYASQRVVRDTALVVTGVAAILVPTALRNWYVGDVFALTTSGAGTNLYGGNNADNPYGRATEFDWVRGIPEHEAGDWKNEAERRTGRTLDPGEVSKYWMGEVAQSVQDDPALHAQILWNKLRLTLGGYEVPDNHSYDWDESFVATLRFLPPAWPLWGFLGLCGVGAYLIVARSERRAWPLMWLNAAYLVTIVLTVTSMRARLPLAVWLMPFAGWYAVAWTQKERRVVLLAAAAVPAAFLAWAPVLPADARAEDLDERRFNLAVYLVEEGSSEMRDRARAIAEDLDQRYPGTSRVMTLAAQLDAQRGFELVGRSGDVTAREEGTRLLGSALDRVRVVLERPEVNARERFRASVVAGAIQIGVGRPEAAVRSFRTAYAFDPNNQEVQLGLANALYLVALRARERGDVGAALPAREAAELLEDLRDGSRDPATRQLLESRLAELRELSR
jgi:hypothetical protein